MINYTLVNGDFRDYDVPKGLIITDPPYNQGYAYNQYKDKLSTEDYISLLSRLTLPCVIIHYPEETINILPKALKTECSQVVTWVYNSNTGKQSRTISWWGIKPDMRKIRQPYKNLKDKRIIDRIQRGFTGSKLYDWWEINQVKNVSKEKTEHPCQIPEEVIRRIILLTASKDTLIIDPFFGSGTTIKVAKELGYNSIGYEVDKRYFDVATERLK